MGFAEARKENFYATLLDTDGFAEQITYYPAGGGPGRDIVAKVKHEQRPESSAHERSETERVVVTLGKDPDHAKGGVLAPLAGDTLVRPGEESLPRFAFVGEIEGSTRHSWRLIFTRETLRRLGNAHRST